ncbi:MAG TPA: hypothetical protein VLZ83_04375 [Edaphocola sp.]|nr:hypothetical protein [Edaphocola sp.]
MRLLTLTILITYLFFAETNAQDISVEKSIWGVQAGIYPLSVYNESKLNDNISLRSEVFLGFGWSSGYSSNSTWAISPYINAEPRWYYNLLRRTKKSKRTDNNSGNYLSIQVGYQPGFGMSSDNANFNPALYAIPTYGLRRNIGKHFNFETALGLGYGWVFNEYKSMYGNSYRETERGRTYSIRFAVGYVF